MKKTFCLILLLISINSLYAYYTTNGKDIVDRRTGERIILRGIGLGGWLLPEGYMWGIRQLDRPWQFEEAITDLIGEDKANEFWQIYHDNYVTEQDFSAMKEWGINTVRIPLLASKLQPVKNQPELPPFIYSEEGFRFLDSIVKWGEKYHLGIIWDMHGAPGAQSKENIADSDGHARLWEEKEKYFPRCIDLWFKIAERYKNYDCIVGYDLLNEPLLRRYTDIDKKLLRELYVLLTDTIRTIDSTGIIFVEGDDWAQNFDILEPLDWDPHLVIAFHSYPPTSNAEGLERWDNLRTKYNLPLWHGETGEQGPPYELNKISTVFLDQANVGWAWWTHKKFENQSQPWSVITTEGFKKILDWWMGRGPRPSSADAEKWLFDQARKTNSRYCVFLPQMVRSLVPLSPESYLSLLQDFAPEILRQPENVTSCKGMSVLFSVAAVGNNLKYQWYKNDQKIKDADDPDLRYIVTRDDKESKLTVKVENQAGKSTSEIALLKTVPYNGEDLISAKSSPVIDGSIDVVWKRAERLSVGKPVYGRIRSPGDFEGFFRTMYDEQNLYFLFEIRDDSTVNQLKERYRNDCIEIYIDPDNDRPKFYSDHEYLIRIIRGQQHAYFERGKISGDIPIKQVNDRDKYFVEVAIPWTETGKFTGEFIGLEIQISDNDSGDRDTKLSWYGDRDNAYRSPMNFGVIRVKK